MARIDRVLAFLQEHREKYAAGISANEIAVELNIHRSDASADLNRLFKQELVRKFGTRPVLYQLQDEAAFSSASSLAAAPNIAAGDSFDRIVGHDGSIKAQVELARAAVVYPPHGLHTLIYGESGVGKNLLAESMWNYAKSCWQQKNGQEIPFVQFGCADYAANEQLLLAQLFGYVKGAFTGANEEHEGVVDRAQGGILFLDEIHRLPPAGQELLFMLIDKGMYRRLGEVNNNRQANIMIIGATSEDLSSSLLMTFRRRIPVQIALPRIGERPIHERIQVILYFVQQEARRLGVPIWVSGKALEVFANYNCVANIGGLKNDVLLCCAKSYLEYSAGTTEYLRVDVQNIPDRIFALVKKHTILDEKIQQMFREGILLNKETDENTVQPGSSQGFHIDFYKYVDRKIAHYRQQGIAEDALAQRVGGDLENYFSSVAQILRKDDASPMPQSIIEESVWELVNELLARAGRKLGRMYGQNTRMAFAWHVQQFKERSASGRKIFNPNLKHIREAYAEEFSFLSAQLDFIETSLEMHITEAEQGFMTVFLVHGLEEAAKAHIGLVLVAHGRGIAQNMAEVANNLLGTDCIRFYDIPLNRSNMQTIEELSSVVQQADEGLGVVLLVDMGFLMTMENTLSQESGVQVRIVPNVTTPMVLEAGQHLFAAAEDLDTAVRGIYDAYDDYVMTIRQRYRSPAPAPEPAVRQKNILLVCGTGQGVAQKIQEILLAEIPEMKQAHFRIVGAVDNIREILQREAFQVDFIVGSIDPKLPGLPFVPVSELFTEQGLEHIRWLLLEDALDEAPAVPSDGKYAATYQLLAAQLDKFVKNLPVRQVADCCVKTVDRIAECFFQGTLEEDGVVRTYLHTACMLDRICAGEALLEPQWGKALRQERAKDFECLQQILLQSAQRLSLAIPDGEVCYFLGSLPVMVKGERKS